MSATTTIAPANLEEVQTAICAHERLVVRGGGTKPALSTTDDGATVLATHRLTGIVEYTPGEFVFTARAGTPLQEIAATLAEHGQYLPFDPPLVAAGATLGGTIAAGLSGSGRQRYGGVRDFLIGVRFVDGQGRLVRGGGKVVKNAAGFDLPRLFVGSIGRLGVVVEASFKVFPQPSQYATVRAPQLTLDDALATIARLNRSTFDLEAVDLLIEDGAPVLYIRQGGLATTLAARQQSLLTWLGGGAPLADEAAFWADANAFAWVPADCTLVKTPLTLHTIPVLEQVLHAHGAQRRYFGGGAAVWIAWTGELDTLDAFLTTLQLSGLILRGAAPWPFIGARPGATLAARVKRVLDPTNRFPTL
ncbi:MAG TPA: FAD-binding protein [Chloroflexi bacterium]|nr:FAD-binding protein [Chloroflexota bacterium]